MPIGIYKRTDKYKQKLSNTRVERGLSKGKNNQAYGKFGKDNPTYKEKNGMWKGDKVGYGALHIWIRRNLGQPTTCEHCGKDNLTGHDIHWANKSGEYLRDKKDWIRLCAKCHKLFDKQTFLSRANKMQM